MGKLLEFFNGSKETKFGQATRDEWYNIVLQPSSPLFVPFAHGLFAPYTSLIMAQSSRKLNITGTGTGRSSSHDLVLIPAGYNGFTFTGIYGDFGTPSIPGPTPVKFTRGGGNAPADDYVRRDNFCICEEQLRRSTSWVLL